MKNMFIVALVLLAFGCDATTDLGPTGMPTGSLTVATDTGTYTYTRTDFLTGHKSMLTEDGEHTVIRVDSGATPDEVIVHVSNLYTPWDPYNYSNNIHDCVFTARLDGSDSTGRWFTSNTVADSCARPLTNSTYILQVRITQDLRRPDQFMLAFRGSRTNNTSGGITSLNMTLRSVN